MDPHALLWALHAPERLTASAQDAIQDPRRAVYFSAASTWELELKAAKGKLALPANWLDVAEQTGFLELPVSSRDAQLSAQLPWHHSDPFDRLLVAQVIRNGLMLASRDPLLSAYAVPLLPV